MRDNKSKKKNFPNVVFQQRKRASSPIIGSLTNHLKNLNFDQQNEALAQ